VTARDPVVFDDLAAAVPLVESKLMPPRQRPRLIRRGRLYEALDALASTELTLVSAPPGGGKSVLLGSWVAQEDSAVAWVSLDVADDDPVRLWTYVATAVDRIRPGLGRLALLRLRTPSVAIEACVDELMNGLAAYDRPVTVVLEDLHVLRDESCLRSIEHAIERLPANARLIATTRSDPAIALSRLRARGQLGELRAHDLAFSTDEARTLLVEAERLPLDDTDVGRLVERSEGWPAGLYMAALWLRTVSDVKAEVRDFAGDHRHVADYLTGEVLDTLEPDVRDLVLRSAVLGRFTAPMCEAVLERDDAAVLLEQLAQTNHFLVPLDGRGEWYRYHHLFGELLQMELRGIDPDAPRALRVRAAAWCREHGLVEEALEHASASGDHELVAELLHEQQAQLVRSGRYATLFRRVSELPEDLLLASPELAAGGALASGLLSRPTDERKRLLAIAERAAVERPESWTPFAESVVSLARTIWIDGDVGAALDHASRAVQLARAGGTETVVAAMAGAAYALLLAGANEEARHAAQEAIDRPEAALRPHGLLYALATLAILEAEAGRAQLAEATARRALAVAAEAGLTTASTTGLAYVALATALAERGHVRQAESEAERGEALRRAAEPRIEHAHALLVLADIRSRRGRLTQAAAELERAREALATFADAGRLGGMADELDRTLAAARNGAVQPAEPPSPAELAVLRLLATDLSQREIGQRLFLSLNTVKSHTKGLYRKLGASSREEAVATASALGYLDGEPLSTA
jgi:LuxR family maltose regulon positive regulatory protein